MLQNHGAAAAAVAALRLSANRGIVGVGEAVKA